ncbi:hypothetical protein KC217_20200, partial [Mycobacterium tuberculosis]|nr:hypothetical protein [Mycobacterium tuberculosis]
MASLLLQPPPDDVYQIDSVGRALLTRTSVQSVFSFSVFKTETPSPKPIDVVNLCYNNRLVVTHGNINELLTFISDRQKQKLQPLLYARS